MFLGHYDFDIPRMAIQTIQTKKSKVSAQKISFAHWISQTNGKIGASSLTGTLVPIATMTRPMTNSSTPIIHPVLATIVTISKLSANIQSIDNANVARYHFLKNHA